MKTQFFTASSRQKYKKLINKLRNEKNIIMKTLTKKQEQIILDFGYTKEDLIQINEALNYTDLDLLIERKDDKKISIQKAIEILGEEEFLSGISRSAFHYTALRNGKYGKSVYFNSYRLFNK